MNVLSGIDWQAIATIAMGLAAVVHVARRFLPSVHGLFAPAGAAVPADASDGARGVKAGAACGAEGASTGGGAASSCASGCGQCGPRATPRKDHSVVWLGRPLR